MFCQKCGNKIPKDAKFCNKCGKPVDELIEKLSVAEHLPDTQNLNKPKKDDIDSQDKSIKAVNDEASLIKCAECHHVGPGKAGRSTFGQILAWSFFGIPTLLYYGMTKKFKCEKCGSKKIQVKKNGLFANGKKTNTAVIVVGAIVGLLLLRFCYAVILASLNTARQKGIEAAEQNTVNTGYLNSNQ